MKKFVGCVSVMLIGFILAVVGVQTLAGSNDDIPDPFFSNADTYIGQPVDVIEEYGFFCTVTDEPQNLWCVPETESDTYSEIRVVSSAGVATEIAFTMQKDAAQLGHLLLFWGRPEVRIYTRSIRFKWRGGHIVAIALSENGATSPALSVWKVYFLDKAA